MYAGAFSDAYIKKPKRKSSGSFLNRVASTIFPHSSQMVQNLMNRSSQSLKIADRQTNSSMSTASSEYFCDDKSQYLPSSSKNSRKGSDGDLIKRRRKTKTDVGKCYLLTQSKANGLKRLMFLFRAHEL